MQQYSILANSTRGVNLETSFLNTFKLAGYILPPIMTMIKFMPDFSAASAYHLWKNSETAVSSCAVTLHYLLSTHGHYRNGANGTHKYSKNIFII
jgi:hypothetical protein